MLVLAAGAATVGAHGLVAPGLADAARLAAAPDLAAAGLDAVLVAACAVAAASCWLWLLAAVAVTLAEALRHDPTPESLPQWVPAAVRLLVTTALGCGVTTPVLAADSGLPAAPGLDGLRLPDRVATAAPAALAKEDATLRVAPGDSLWSIAAGLLPAGASNAVVDRGWRRLAAVNADHLGPDPDLIRPGTPLRVPPLLIAPGKDIP
jgi:hypothetical protein